MTQAEKKMKNYVNAVERRLKRRRVIMAIFRCVLHSSIVARREAGLTALVLYP